MRAAKFPFVLLALWAGTAAAAASSSCGGESGGGKPDAGDSDARGGGGSGGGGVCTSGCGGADAGDDGDAATTDGDADTTDAPCDAPKDALPDTGEDALADADADAEPGDDAGDASDGSTAIPCAAQAPQCPGTLSCCNTVCLDIHKDPQNCGACGVACGGTQFCTGAACSPVALRNVCQNSAASVSFDAYPIDNAAGSQVGDGLVTHCNPNVTIRQLDQSSPLLLDQVTNRPITGPGDTLVAGGGSFGQRGLAYLDALGHSPLYATMGPTGNLLLIRRGTGTPLVDAPAASLTDHHDYFAFYVAVEPKSGTLVLAAFGLMGPGTRVAGWYWQNVIAPSLSTYDKGWYVYEWTDLNADALPDSGDTFALVGSGP